MEVGLPRVVECVRRPRVGEHAFTSHHLPNNIVQAFEQQAAEEWCPPFLELDTTNKTSREGGLEGHFQGWLRPKTTTINMPADEYKRRRGVVSLRPTRGALRPTGQ